MVFRPLPRGHRFYCCCRQSLLIPPTLTAEPSDIESNLTIAIGGAEKQVSLAEAMAALNIPAASIALIDQDQIAFARAYGDGVVPDSQFQAASLSKFVTAVGALRLVYQKRLSLDIDVNAGLTSWKVPTNAFDKDQPVTLRGLLSMTGGIGVPVLSAMRSAPRCRHSRKFLMARRLRTRRR